MPQLIKVTRKIKDFVGALWDFKEKHSTELQKEWRKEFDA